MTEKALGQCSHRHLEGFSTYKRCPHKAKALRDGKPYCGVHDPQRLAAKTAARRTVYDIKWAREQKRHSTERELIEAALEVAKDWSASPALSGSSLVRAAAAYRDARKP